LAQGCGISQEMHIAMRIFGVAVLIIRKAPKNISAACYYSNLWVIGNKNPHNHISSQKLWMKQILWIYRFQTTAFCCILCDVVLEDTVIRLGQNLSATASAHTMWVVTPLFPSIFDYASAYNAINPALQ
jgi:hypothetical protein